MNRHDNFYYDQLHNTWQMSDICQHIDRPILILSYFRKPYDVDLGSLDLNDTNYVTMDTKT